MTAVLELANVRFRWEGQARALLDVASLVVAAGEKLLLRGPSGSGKTTLLSLMAGVAAPSEGEVRLLGEEMGRLGLGRRDRMRADHIGYVFQLFNLVPYLTARENILLALRFSPLRRRRLAEAGKLGESEAGRLASGLGLDAALLDRPPTALSVGQQQRVACARALIGSPELVLADEPTSALDEEAREAFLKLLFSECDEAGTALLVVSHDRDLVRLFDRVVEMSALTGAKS